MKTYKYLSIIFLLAMTMSLANAQEKVKYKDLFPVIISSPPEVAYPKLLQYQRQEPENDNAYYHLGVIASNWSKDYSPIAEYEQVKYFTYNTNLYFGLAKFNLDEKDARKNREYYTYVQPAEGAKKVEYNDILSDIEARMEQNKDFENKIDTIKIYYDATVEFYNTCIENYKSIISTYNKLKDIYLMADDDLFTKARQIQTDFDSAMIYFEKYKKATKAYPVYKYEQNVELKQIDTYRLQGLTSADFRKENIEVWDYGTWSKNLFAMFDSDIADLRNEISETNRQFDRSVDYLLTTDQFDAEPDVFKMHRRTVNLIKKYDNQSIIPSLFEYKQAKVDYLSLTKNPLNNTKDTTDVPLLKHARFYSDLVKTKLEIDTVNQNFRDAITSESDKKYKDFISENFKDIDGLKQYSTEQDTENKEVLNKAIANMKVFVLKYINRFKTNPYAVKYEDKKIPMLAVVPPLRDTSRNHYHTVVIEPDPYGGYYAAGYFNNEKQKREAYIAKITDSRELVWLKRFAFKSAENEELNNIGMQIQAADSSCYLLINAKKSFGSQMENFLVRLSIDGEEELSIRLEAKQMPRYMHFDDINERLLIAFKGIRYDPLAPDLGKLTIDFTDPDGVKIWSQDIQMIGSLIDIVKMNRNLLVFCNFNQFISPQEGMITAKCEEDRSKTNMFVTVLDQSGAVLRNRIYYSEQPFFGIRAVKVDSETINIVGMQGAINIKNSEELNPASNFFYMLTNKNGKIIYTNMDGIED